jgi:hypothetical protein
MTGGAELSARERKRGRGCGWAGLLGRARLLGHATRASAQAWEWARARGQAVQLGQAGGRKEESARVEFFFFFLKNVNSNNICLFH